MSAARSVNAEFTRVVATINDPSIIEGDAGTQGLVFTVTLTPAPGHPVTVQFSTANGTAVAGPVTAGGDYVATSSPPLAALSYGPNDTQRTITVPVNGDLLAESTETFSVNLTASGAMIAPGPPGQGVGTILDDGDICTHVGTPGDDILTGSAGNDVLCGLSGNDTILAGAGNDLLFGDDGADVLLGFAGNDTIRGGPGADRVQGMEGNDILDGEGGEDWLSYESASGVDVDAAVINVFQAVGGGAGSDRLEEYFHNIAGSNGEDTLLGNHLGNTIVANNGDDQVKGRDGNDQLFGSENSDRLFGQDGNDHLNGGRNPPGDDRDICNGGQGSDTTDFCETTAAVP
jgi:Ca2+-binding RTX toxin-like protein